MSHHIGSSRSRVCHLIFTPCICAFLFDLFDLPFYFNLSFSVFFHSSVLMHPDLHTDLDNLESVANNLRHSAKGSLDAYDVIFSLTGYEPNDTVSNELVDSQGPFSYVVSQSSLSVASDRTGKPVGESSSSAQIRTLFDEQRRTIIEERCEKVSHHELEAARAEQDRQFLTRRITASAKKDVFS